MNNKAKMIAGVLTPRILQAWQANGSSDIALEAQLCHVIEIRYDLFPSSLWPFLAAQVADLAPQALRLATIRLQCDGGQFADKESANRWDAWQEILSADVLPHWVDMEQDHFQDLPHLVTLAHTKNCKVLASRHDFQCVPSLDTLREYVDVSRQWNVEGFKIAAMAHHPQDCEPLYQIIQEQASGFEVFSAFAMGAAGQISRTKSYQYGANLGYGAIGEIVAPGQISVQSMLETLRVEA